MPSAAGTAVHSSLAHASLRTACDAPIWAPGLQFFDLHSRAQPVPSVELEEHLAAAPLPTLALPPTPHAHTRQPLNPAGEPGSRAQASLPPW